MLLDLLSSNSPCFRSLQRLRGLLSTATAALVLTACGGATEPATTGDMSIRLSGSASAISNGHIVAKAVSENLLDLNRSWGTWSGEASGVTYNADTGLLSIPASSDSVAMVTAVERYELPLVAGTEYTLAVQASHPEMAAVLFLFDTDGAIVPVPGVTDSLASVRPAAPLTFVAPQNIAGLYLQVQNRWQAGEDGSLSAQLTFDDGESDTGGEVEPPSAGATELLDPSGPWTAWDGTDNGVVFEADAQVVVINTPDGNAGNRYGIRRFDLSLTAGITYTLSTLGASDNSASSLLFLFDAGGTLVPFVDSQTGGSQTWIAASTGQPVSFVAPEGITSVVVQVQSAWMASAPTRLVPSLATNGDGMSCTRSFSGLSAPTVLPDATSAHHFRDASISADGRWTTFSSLTTHSNILDVNATVHQQIKLYDAQNASLQAILPTDPSTDGEFVYPTISADGSTIYFVSTAQDVIADQGTADSTVSLFRYDRETGNVTLAATASDSYHMRPIKVSPDGTRALIVGFADLLIDESDLDPALASSVLIEHNAITNTLVARPFPRELEGREMMVSDDLNHVVYQTYSHPIFINGVFSGYTEPNYVYHNLVTGESSVIAPSNNTLSSTPWTHDISANGQYVVFEGAGTPFTSYGEQFDGNALYRWENGTGRIEEVARHDVTGRSLQSPSISGDGNLVAYRHALSPPGFSPIFEIRVTSLLNNQTFGVTPADYAAAPKLSDDGSAIVFDSRIDQILQPAWVSLEFDCEP